MKPFLYHPPYSYHPIALYLMLFDVSVLYIMGSNIAFLRNERFFIRSPAFCVLTLQPCYSKKKVKRRIIRCLHYSLNWKSFSSHVQYVSCNYLCFYINSSTNRNNESKKMSKNLPYTYAIFTDIIGLLY